MQPEDVEGLTVGWLLDLVTEHRPEDDALWSTKKEGSSLTEDDVKEYCRKNIARHKVPKYVDCVEEYPMTASGKIQKYKLREAAVERHDLVEAT